MLLPRATMLALTADHPPAQTITAAWSGGDYWLGHCEGFAVRSPEGEVGIVESVVYAAADAARPAYLAVTGGRLLLHTALVPCAEVVSIDARQARLDVQARPARQSLRTAVAEGARRVSHRGAARGEGARWKST